MSRATGPNRKKNIALKRRMVLILKQCEGRPVSANEMVGLLIDSGLSQRYMKNAVGLGLILKNTAGVARYTTNFADCGGQTYSSYGYHLEDEKAFDEWLVSKGC